jgi:hypothetical protein
VTSLLHRSPRTNLTPEPNDLELDPAPAGFTLLRTGNVLPAGNPITGSQDTVGPTPYIIYGFGQTAGSFQGQYPATVTSGTSNQHTAVGWDANLLIAEGAYNAAQGLPSIVSSAAANIFNGPDGIGTSSALVELIVLGGNTPPVVGDLGPLLGDQSSNGPNVPTIVSGTLPAADDGGVAALSWMFDGASTGPGAPLNAPTLDPLTGLFSWDVNGQMGGLYTFPIKATDAGGLSDGGLLSVQVIVPEPATVCLIGLALVGFAGFRRK